MLARCVPASLAAPSSRGERGQGDGRGLLPLAKGRRARSRRHGDLLLQAATALTSGSEGRRAPSGAGGGGGPRVRMAAPRRPVLCATELAGGASGSERL